MLTKNSTLSLSEQLRDRFAQRIQSRLLSAGARLPSVRQCAQQQGVSPSTVVAAYDQLLALGLVESRRNRGFYVREFSNFFTKNQPVAGASIAYDAINSVAKNANHLETNAPSVSATQTPATMRALTPAPVNAAMLIRGMFRQAGPKPQPGMGVFPPEWLDNPFLSAAVRKVTTPAALKQFSLEYGDPMGDANLRQSLSNKLAQMNISAAPSQIISTVGATHALDVVSRTLLRAGDAVMVEEPGWAVEFARLQALGMQILPVPRRADESDLDVMAKYCDIHKPKLMVSVSVLHNPTGYMLSPHSAHRMLQLANEHNFHIMEDDSYSHIAPDHATRLCALDGLQRTIYVSGFAKILAPNWRVGYMAAPEDLIERLLDTKLLATLTTPALLEKAISLCIDQGQLRRHATSIRAKLAAARGRTVKLALAHGCTFASEPAGLFGWVDTGVDTDQLAQRMLDHGYLLAPGALFHASRQPSTLMRINFATTQNAEFWKVFKKKLSRLVNNK